MLWHHLIHLVARKHVGRMGAAADLPPRDGSPRARRAGADRIIAVIFLLVAAATLAVLWGGAPATPDPVPPARAP